MKRLLAVVLALVALLALPGAALAAKPRDKHVQLLAINDLHGHLAPNTPGTIQVGCCNPVRNTHGRADRVDAEDRAGGRHRVPRHAHQDAAGHEPEHDHGRRRRPDRREPARLGALPRRAHDRGVELDRHGRHRRRQPRVRRGRRRAAADAATATSSAATAAIPSTAARTARPFGGSLFQYLAANVFYAGTDETILPPYEVRKVGNAKIAFIGLTFEGTPDRRDAERPSRGSSSGRRSRRSTRSSTSCATSRASRRSSCCCTRAARRGRRRRRRSRAAPNGDEYTDVNRVRELQRARDAADRGRARPARAA